MQVAGGAGRHMISSLSVSSGLTVSDVQKLFGANTATATTSDSTPSASPSSADDDASTASDPASVIKAILASAQINQSPTVTLGGADSGAQYYSEQIGAAYSESRTSSPSGQTVQITQAYMTATQGGSALAVTAGNGVDTDSTDGVAFTTSLSFSSVSAADGDDSASVDNFQETVTLGDDSVTVGFSVAGLGPLTVQNNEIIGGQGSLQGSLQDFFQVDVSVDDHTVGLSFNVGGLNSEQANALGAAFEAATSAPAGAMANSSNAKEYTQNYGNGFSADITDIIGY
jgi:hypothetical protein